MNKKDAILVLKKLGYKQNDINFALKNIDDNSSLDDIIKQALSVLKGGFSLQTSQKKTIPLTYDFNALVAPTQHWMLNSYAKHTELTKEDIEAYFKARKGQTNATS